VNIVVVITSEHECVGFFNFREIIIVKLINVIKVFEGMSYFLSAVVVLTECVAGFIQFIGIVFLFIMLLLMVIGLTLFV
jgi:hypothetical protein